MAIITRVDYLDPLCTITITYNDSTMKMTGVSAVNNGSKTLRIYLISPLTLERTVAPGNTLSYSIPTSNRPSFRINTGSKSVTKIDIPQIEDIVWRATYGV
jgi:hypothetical protein